MKQAIDSIVTSKQAWLKHWEQQAVRTATAIASRVIRREVSKKPEITLALVREALELAAGGSEVQVQLNPTDHAALGPASETARG